jgi:hypothetical protein
MWAFSSPAWSARRPAARRRAGGGDAVGVELVRVRPFGLQEDLVAVLVGKAVDLVLDAGAVARAHAFDHAGEHRAAVEAAADDVVRALVGVGDPAGHLARVLAGVAEEAEHRHRIHVAGLLGAPGEVDAAAVEARRRAGLQAALRQLQFLQPGRQADRRRVAGAAGRRSWPGRRGPCRPGRCRRSAPPPARKRMPTWVTAPTTRSPSTSRSSTACWNSHRLGWFSSRRRIAALYSTRSACARVARTAGPWRN